MVLVSLAVLLLGCATKAWEQDPAVHSVKLACQGLDEMERYACIERHAVEGRDPDVCRLAGIWIDDMCLQAVYEAADDPAICARIYLQGVRPNCRAFYAARAEGAAAAPDSYPGWVTYTHPIYGFSFRHPPEWQARQHPGVPNIVRLRPLGGPDVELSIGFRRPDEETAIQRTGVGAGDVETRGSVRFLGRELAREVLIYEGKVKAILYNNAMEIDVDRLIFTVSLDVRAPDLDAADISPAVQAIVDQIVSSLVLTSE